MIALLLGVLLATEPGPPLPRVLLRTGLGDVVVEVDVVRAPSTARNFLAYVDRGLYRGGSFHRTVTRSPDNQPASPVKIEVIQAGPAQGRPELPPVPLERTRDTGLRHLDGCLSMARDGPDTATGDFFVCVGDQPELDFGGRRNPDGQGFGAFGRVVEGLDVVRRIHRAPARGQSLAPPVPIVDAVRLSPAPARARP